jgi:hypothetical protein
MTFLMRTGHRYESSDICALAKQPGRKGAP